MKKVVLFFILMLVSPVFASDYTVHKLENGQTVVIQEEHNNPIVTIDTWVKTGSVDETDVNSGVSHFLEHLFFKGTKTNPVGEFDRLLESKGAVINAATSKDYTHYYIVIPSKFFDLALDLHADMLLNPQIPRKELEKERKVVLEEIARNENDPERILYENLNTLMYLDHPYKRKVIGSASVIETIRREEILEYYNSHYAPSNMVTVIVGDVNTQDVLTKVAKNFSSEPRKLVKHSVKKAKPLSEKKVLVENADVNAGYMMMGFRGVPIADNDTYALDVLSTILGDGTSSKFYQTIKENKQLVFSIGAANSSLKDDGIFYINTKFEPNNLEKVENAIFNEIENLKKFGVSAKELSIAKSIIEKDTYYSRESVSKIASGIGYTYVLTENPNYYRDYLANIAKVSEQDVKRVANKYLAENKAGISVILPKSSASKEVKISHTKEFQSPVLNFENSNQKKYTLGNGAKLILTPNDVNDILAIEICIKGGEFLENIPGTSMLMTGLMKQGSQKYTSAELAKLLDENGIKLGFASTPDVLKISLLTTKAKEQLALDILEEVVNNPKFDDYELEKKRTEIINKIKQANDEPINQAVDKFKALIYGDSVYGKSSALLLKNLPKVSRNDVVKFHEAIFTPNNIVISVNGKIDENLLLERFVSIFNNQKGDEFSYSTLRVPQLSTSQYSRISKSGQKTAWLVLGWRTSGLDNEKDYAVLEVIDTILGSGMSSRLFRNLREQEGLAYQLGSSYSPKFVGGVFLTYIGTNPQSLEFAKKKILEEVYKLKSEFVSEKELRDAKDRIAGAYIIGLETNSQKAAMAAQDELVGSPLYRDGKYLELIEKVSVSDIIDVANRYFNDIYVVSVVSE